jgi:diaminopimelate decarboxylase
VLSTGLRLILEPGRSMVATSSALVNTVRTQHAPSGPEQTSCEIVDTQCEIALLENKAVLREVHQYFER